eukprot:TRINITY_DN61_c0_g1_i2.p2 TRINITY_DN61_c0_g1~~TRINITY_DN61_c0_g1_i2.p2  ORF type:complete len:60 (-),score=14.71 TRINITY_DN61_c0_g1_i2:2-181(-)
MEEAFCLQYLFLRLLVLCGLCHNTPVINVGSNIHKSLIDAHVLCVDTGRSSETAKAHRG